MSSCLALLAGCPGLGKSTSAQLLGRDHGYVYYEADCFLSLKNPYIPVEAEEPSLALMNQRKLVGEGAAERALMVARTKKQMQAKVQGLEWEPAVVETAYREMCRDIARERRRLGGDWAVAGFMDSRALRDLARLDFTSIVIDCCFLCQVRARRKAADCGAGHDAGGTEGED